MPGIEPLSAGILAGGGMLSGMFGGGEQDRGPGKPHAMYMDPYQGLLFQKNIKDYMAGRGDFGFGALAKQGKSQLSQFMADRGIAPDSGFATAGMADAMMRAASGDMQNRRNYGIQLAGMQPNLMFGEQGFGAVPGNLETDWSYAFNRPQL